MILNSPTLIPLQRVTRLPSGYVRSDIIWVNPEAVATVVTQGKHPNTDANSSSLTMTVTDAGEHICFLVEGTAEEVAYALNERSMHYAPDPWPYSTRADPPGDAADS